MCVVLFVCCVVLCCVCVCVLCCVVRVCVAVCDGTAPISRFRDFALSRRAARADPMGGASDAPLPRSPLKTSFEDFFRRLLLKVSFEDFF